MKIGIPIILRENQFQIVGGDVLNAADRAAEMKEESSEKPLRKELE